MKLIATSALSVVLLAQLSPAQSLGDIARKERQRKAQEQKSGAPISTDEIGAGKIDFSPALDPKRKDDLEYLLQQLSRPRATAELLAAFVPLKDRAVPRLLPLLGSTDPLKRVAPAAALVVLGNSEGLAAMTRLLLDATEALSARDPMVAPATGSPSPEVVRKKIEQSRTAAYAMQGTKLGVWRFTEGSALTPEQVVQRLQQAAIEIVGGPDNGQKIFSSALRAPDANVRRGAIALIKIASGGSDFGYLPDQAAAQNESAIQQIVNFVTTERGKVMAQLAAKTQ